MMNEASSTVVQTNSTSEHVNIEAQQPHQNISKVVNITLNATNQT